MQNVTVLDGAMGGELQRRTGKSGGLWSAQALLDDPDLVRRVHQDYVDAGARVIITNTYSTIPSYLAKSGLESRWLELAALAGRIAREVADGARASVQVAGSLPPLDESYRWDLAPADEKARALYLQLAETLDPFVDLFLCETMSCVREARNAVSAARQTAGADKSVWVSWTLDEQPGCGLRSGEAIEDALAAVSDYQVDAYLFNCTAPAAITAGIETLSKLTDKPIGAYPNVLHIPAGWTLDNEVATGVTELSVDAYLEHARTWREQGAKFIGGCCGIGPEYIHALAAAR